MGNYTSCFYIKRSNPKTARLMDSKGNFRQVMAPVKAAELMLEEPGYVVSSVRELLRTGRVIALKAEDDLLGGKLYLFVSLNRVNRKICESDMKFIESAVAADKTSKKSKRGSKVSPAVPVEVKEAEEIESTEIDLVLEEQDTGFVGCRLRNYRQWTPVLEPVFEEP